MTGVAPTGSRTTTSTATFAHAFTLGRDPRPLPPGTYTLHTQEDAHAGPLHTAYVATSIDVIVPEAPGRTAVRIIKPADLAVALFRDLALSRGARA